MKILEINTEKTWRGGERQTLYTVQGITEAGHTVALVCLSNSPLAAKAKQEDIQPIELNSQWSLFLYLVHLGKMYDVIHVQNSKALIWAVLSKWFHRRPVVYTRRVDFVPSGFFTIWKYNRADKIVAISEAIRNILIKQGVKQVEVIPSMVKENKLNKANAEQVIEQIGLHGKKIIGTTAAFVPHKDPHTMVQAIAALKKIRTDFVFLHFGEGILQQEIKEEVKKSGLEDQYIFMGFHKDAEDFFSVFDVFVMSSEQEGLGSSVLDAFLYRVPVASTDAGGLKETVEGCGLVSPVKDYNALSANINRLLNDETLRSDLTEKAKQRVSEKYSIEKNTEAYLGLYQKMQRS